MSHDDHSYMIDDRIFLANQQIAKMHEELDKCQKNDPKTKALSEAAFGTKADAFKINRVIKSLETGTATVQVATLLQADK